MNEIHHALKSSSAGAHQLFARRVFRRVFGLQRRPVPNWPMIPWPLISAPWSSSWSFGDNGKRWRPMPGYVSRRKLDPLPSHRRPPPHLMPVILSGWPPAKICHLRLLRPAWVSIRRNWTLSASQDLDRYDESASFCPTTTRIDISLDQLLPCPSFLPPAVTHNL